MGKHTKAGRRASFREHCTGASRHRKRVARVMRENLRRQFGYGTFVVEHAVVRPIDVYTSVSDEPMPRFVTQGRTM